ETATVRGDAEVVAVPADTVEMLGQDEGRRPLLTLTGIVVGRGIRRVGRRLLGPGLRTRGPGVRRTLCPRPFAPAAVPGIGLDLNVLGFVAGRRAGRAIAH